MFRIAPEIAEIEQKRSICSSSASGGWTRWSLLPGWGSEGTRVDYGVVEGGARGRIMNGIAR